MIYRACTLLITVMVWAWPVVAGVDVAAQDGAASAAAMSIEDLGLPDGASDATPVDIDNNSTVVVTAVTDEGASVFLYESGAFRQIGGADATGSVHATAINDNGIVSGWTEGDNGAASALIVGDENLVEMPGEVVSSRALVVNSEGILAGEATIDGGDSLASPVYWTSTTVERLPSAGDGNWGAVNDMNTIEQMAGWSAIDAAG